jgi:hypothetical protein
MSVRWTNLFWSVSLELTLFLDFLNIFVRMCLAIGFAGKKIVFFGPTDQKLWTFEVLKRSRGRAGMCWSQPARVDYISPKRWAVGKRNLEKSPLEFRLQTFEPCPYTWKGEIFPPSWSMEILIFFKFYFC